MTKTAKTQNRFRSAIDKRRIAPAVMSIGAKTLTLLGFLVAVYLLVFFAAIQMVPFTMSFVQTGSGVTFDMPLEAVVTVWLMPALFLVAMIFALALFAIKVLWRLRRRILAAVDVAVYGTTEVRDPIAIKTGNPRSARARASN